MTQPQLRAALLEEEGWNLYHSNYSAYENDRQVPEGESLQRFIRFWQRRGEPEPDFTPPPEPEPEPTLAAALIALATELRLSREARESLENRLAAAEATLATLTASHGETPTGRGARSPLPAG